MSKSYVLNPADDEPGGPGVLKSMHILTTRSFLDMQRQPDGSLYVITERFDRDEAPEESEDSED